MADLTVIDGYGEAGEAGEAGQDDPMGDDEFQNAVRTEAESAQNWIRQDVSPGRERGYRYYNGECDVASQKGRSKFVQRVVRDCTEQAIPQLMRIFTGGLNIVSFQATQIDEQAETAAAEATEAFNHIYWNANPGWDNTLTILKDCLKANTGTFKAYVKETVTMKPVPFYGPVEMLEAALEQDGVDLEEVEYKTETGYRPGFFGPVEIEIEVAEAVLRKKDVKSNICIDGVAPEEFIIDKDATGTGQNEYRMIGQRCVKTVSDVVDMGVPWDVAIQYGGATANPQTSGNQDQIRRARSQRSGILYEQTPNDPASQPIVVYDLFMYIDKDGDGHAELRHIIGIGDGPAYIHEDELAEEHYFFTSPAIMVEHNVIGDSMADNLTDLQDIETQLSRNMLNNMSQVANPRPMTKENMVDVGALRSSEFGAEIPVSEAGAVEWLLTPFVADKLLGIRESFNETKAERTGISKESMGLAAQNLQSSSEIGVLAVLGAGQTQPEMIAATIAHKAFVPMSRYVVKLIKQQANTEEGLTIRTAQGLKQVNPDTWPDEFDVEVKVGLGTGTRDENLATLNQTAAKQLQAIQIQESVGAPDLLTDAAKLVETNHRILKLSGIGESTAFWNDPEEVEQRLTDMRKKAAETPPQPSDTDKKLAADAQKAQADNAADMEKASLQAQTDVTTQAMGDETRLKVQAMQDTVDRMELQQEAMLALLKAQQGEKLESSDVNLDA